MRFEHPDAVDRMRESLVDVDTSGDSTDEVGQPLDHGVRTVLPGYAEKLQFTLDPAPDDVRRELARIRWGMIDQEAARLTGLGAALDDVADCITSGIKRLEAEQAWGGDAFEAFKQTAGTVVRSMSEASARLRDTGKRIEQTTQELRELFSGDEGYRLSSERLFEFEGLPQYDELHLLDGETIDTIPLCGMDCHNEDGSGPDITETLPGDVRAYGRRAIARAKASMKVLTSHWLRWYKEWDGTDHESDINLSTQRTEQECAPIPMAITAWYTSTAAAKAGVTKLHDDIVRQVSDFAESDHFRKLKDDVVR